MRFLLSWLLPISVYGQLIVSSYSSQLINRNFIIEYHNQKDRNFKSYVYIVQFDTIVPRLEIQFSSEKELTYFNNYIRCFLSECHRDRQPLLLPKLGTLVYNKDQRAYTLPNSKSIYFRRYALVQFARAIKRNERKGKRKSTNAGWQRYKIFF